MFGTVFKKIEIVIKNARAKNLLIKKLQSVEFENDSNIGLGNELILVESEL